MPKVDDKRWKTPTDTGVDVKHCNEDRDSRYSMCSCVQKIKKKWCPSQWVAACVCCEQC